MSVLHGVKGRQVACLPCQAFAADAIRSSLHLVLLCFGTVFCVCHRFELSFGHLGTKERRAGKERAPLVPHYKVAVFGRTQLVADTGCCAKLLIDDPPGPPCAMNRGSGARFSASLLMMTVAN